MNLLRRAWMRLIKFHFGGEAFLELRCTACGYVLLRRIEGNEFEDYILHPESFEEQVCHSCEKGSFSVRLLTEKSFRKKYPDYLQGG